MGLLLPLRSTISHPPPQRRALHSVQKPVTYLQPTADGPARGPPAPTGASQPRPGPRAAGGTGRRAPEAELRLGGFPRPPWDPLPFAASKAHMHTHAHTVVHTRIDTLIHSHIHTYNYSHMLADTYMHTHTQYTQLHTHAHSHPHTDTRAFSRLHISSTHIHAHTYMHAHTLAHTLMPSCTLTRAHTHAHSLDTVPVRWSPGLGTLAWR